MRSYSFTEAWLAAIDGVVHDGQRVAPRGLKTLEKTFVQLEVDDPLSFPLRVVGRELRDVIGVLEGLSLVGQVNFPEMFSDRVPKFSQFEDDGVLWGAYGARVHGQVGDVVRLLEEDPDSRQAVLTFYDSGRDLRRAKRDVPCTLSAQFLLRQHRDGPEPDDVHRYLDARVTMRSNDLWLGTPYDFVQFGILQATIAQALGVRPGRYVHSAGSLHLYAHDVEKARGLSFLGRPSMPFPLWYSRDVGAIAGRARMLLTGDLTPATDFERWADSVLRP